MHHHRDQSNKSSTQATFQSVNINGNIRKESQNHTLKLSGFEDELNAYVNERSGNYINDSNVEPNAQYGHK